MEEFGEFEQPPAQEQYTGEQYTDLFGTENPANTSITNSFDNNELGESSWTMNSNVADTTTSQSNLFDDDISSAPSSSVLLFDEQPVTDQSNTNELASFSTDNLENSSAKSPAEETSSYEMFSQPVPSTNTVDYSRSTGSFSEENLSVLEAFNRRRQKEIAEKDAIENKNIEQLRQQAKGDIERWYKDRTMRMEQNRQKINTEEEDLRQKAAEKSDPKFCDWAKVIRFLEFSPGTQLSKAKRDLSRMKISIINAKRDQDKRESVNCS